MDKMIEKIEIVLTDARETKRTHLFTEEVGEQSYSDQDVAVGSLYIKTQALEMIGNPAKIKVTIEPA